MHQKKAKKILEYTKQTYNTIAKEFSQSRRYIGKEFELFRPYLKQNQHITDLGCGNGRIIDFLKTENHKFIYTGIDNSTKLLKEAKKKYPDQKFTEGKLEKIPLPDEKTVLIFCIRAFHHLPSKKLQLESLAEMKRILKKNGILILTVWNLWQKKYWKELAKALFRSIFTFGKYRFNDTFIPWNKKQWRYYHAFTEAELKKLFKKSSFKILQFISRKDQIAKGINDYVIIAEKI